MYEFLYYQVADAMTAEPVAIGLQTSLAEVEVLFQRHDFNGLPVIDNDRRLLGVMTKLDFLKAFAFTPQALLPPYEEIMGQPVERFMTGGPTTVSSPTPLTRVLQQMIETRYKSLPVVDDGRLVGMIAREDVLRALRRAVAGEPAPTSPRSKQRG